MSSNNSNNLVVPQAREAMERFKMEAASDMACFYHLKIT